MFYVYVLWSNSLGRTYTGSTKDVTERLLRHNAGHSKSTKAGTPWILVYKEEFLTRSEAMDRECHYKTGHGREELNRLIPPMV